ncbi:unnamed protein product [Closterium sp. Yama58-4]|nr:unnamed protein product [Closterium sp. Yama58-4]
MVKDAYSGAVDWILWAACGSDPESALQSLGQSGASGVCGAVWGASDIAYRCRTCEHDPTCAICVPCFLDGDHEGHDYAMIKTGGGCCDCGDPTAWKRQGFCKKHPGPGHAPPLPESFVARAEPVLAAVAAEWQQKIVFAARLEEERSGAAAGWGGSGFGFGASPPSTTAAAAMSTSLLEALVANEEGIKEDAMLVAHRLLYKLLGDPGFKYQFALAFVANYSAFVLGSGGRDDGEEDAGRWGDSYGAGADAEARGRGSVAGYPAGNPAEHAAGGAGARWAHQSIPRGGAQWASDRRHSLRPFPLRFLMCPSLPPLNRPPFPHPLPRSYSQLSQEEVRDWRVTDNIRYVLSHSASSCALLSFFANNPPPPPSLSPQLSREEVRNGRVTDDIRYVLSHSASSRHVTARRPDLLRAWLRQLAAAQGMCPHVRRTTTHVAIEPDDWSFAYLLEAQLATVNPLLAEASAVPGLEARKEGRQVEGGSGGEKVGEKAGEGGGFPGLGFGRRKTLRWSAFASFPSGAAGNAGAAAGAAAAAAAGTAGGGAGREGGEEGGGGAEAGVGAGVGAGAGLGRLGLRDGQGNAAAAAAASAAAAAAAAGPGAAGAGAGRGGEEHGRQEGEDAGHMQRGHMGILSNWLRRASRFRATGGEGAQGRHTGAGESAGAEAGWADGEARGAGGAGGAGVAGGGEEAATAMQTDSSAATEAAPLSAAPLPSAAPPLSAAAAVVEYDVGRQEVSFHLPLHRMLALLLHSLLRLSCPVPDPQGDPQEDLKRREGEGRMVESTPDKMEERQWEREHEAGGGGGEGAELCLLRLLPSKLQRGSFLAAVAEHGLRVQVLCAQISAGMWRRNGQSMVALCDLYHSVHWCEDSLELDLFLLQCTAVSAPPDAFVRQVVARYNLTGYFSLTVGTASEYEPAVAQDCLAFLIRLISERSFSGLPPTAALRREIVQRLAIGNATRSSVVKSLPPRFAENPAIPAVLAAVADYSRPSGMEQGRYLLKRDCYRELDLYCLRWAPRELQRAEERYAEAVKRSAVVEQTPRWRDPVRPLMGLREIATSAGVHDVVLSVVLHAWCWQRQAGTKHSTSAAAAAAGAAGSAGMGLGFGGDVSRGTEDEEGGSTAAGGRAGGAGRGEGGEGRAELHVLVLRLLKRFSQLSDECRRALEVLCPEEFDKGKGKAVVGGGGGGAGKAGVAVAERAGGAGGAGVEVGGGVGIGGSEAEVGESGRGSGGGGGGGEEKGEGGVLSEADAKKAFARARQQALLVCALHYATLYDTA